MKIQIELKNSDRAEIEVDGKKFSYGLNFNSGGWRFDDNISNEEIEYTLGGMVISKLCEDMSSILQEWRPDRESPSGEDWETWETLPEEVVEEIEDSWF